MRTFRSKKGPFAKTLHFTPNEIEDICSRELRAADLYPCEPGPIRIERFVEKRFGVSPSYEDMPEGVLGFTEFGINGVCAIVVSSIFEIVGSNQVLERRLRTTLAHEAGHGLMHAKLFALKDKPLSLFDESSENPTILCRDVIGEDTIRRRYDGRWWEYQANKAIGGLLMPRDLLQSAAAKFLTPVGSLGLLVLAADRRDAAIRAVANIFDVNPVVAQYRLDEIFPKGGAEQPTL